MLFVTVGTTDFDGLIQTMDHLAAKLDEKVVAQIGKGKYTPDHMDHFRFAPSLDRYFDMARIVISHGGLGTILEVLKKGRKLIGINNPDRYDLHQEELLEVLEEQGHLIWCRNMSHLAEALHKAEAQTFIPYNKPRCTIAEVIKDYLDRSILK
jgi:UDP-N-acetylglucosamine transferase subunit ALG13